MEKEKTWRNSCFGIMPRVAEGNSFFETKKITGSDVRSSHLFPHNTDRVMDPAQVEPVKDIISENGVEGKDIKVSI